MTKPTATAWFLAGWSRARDASRPGSHQRVRTHVRAVTAVRRRVREEMDNEREGRG